MGRGGYFGGSTIVGRFGWSSFDPASVGKKTVKKRRAKTKRPSATSAKKGGQQRTQKTQKALKPKAVQQAAITPKKRDSLRLIFLDTIILAALRSQHAPNPPKPVREELLREVATAGGAVEWAKAQPQYAKTLERLRTRVELKAARAKPEPSVQVERKLAKTEPTPKFTLVKVRQRPLQVPKDEKSGLQKVHTRRADLTAERAKLSSELIKAKELVRNLQTNIKRIEVELATIR